VRASSSRSPSLKNGGQRSNRLVSIIMNLPNDNNQTVVRRRDLLPILYKAIVSKALGSARCRDDVTSESMLSLLKFVPDIHDLDNLLLPSSSDDADDVILNVGAVDGRMWMEGQDLAVDFEASWVKTIDTAPTQQEHFGVRRRGSLVAKFFTLSYMHWHEHSRSTNENGVARLHPATLGALAGQTIIFGGLHAPSQLWHDGCKHYGASKLWGPITGLMFYSVNSATVLKIADDARATPQLWLYSEPGCREEACLSQLIAVLGGECLLPLSIEVEGRDFQVKGRGILPPPVRIGGSDRFWMLAETAIGILRDGITTTLKQAAQIFYTLAWFKQVVEVLEMRCLPVTLKDAKTFVKQDCCCIGPSGSVLELQREHCFGEGLTETPGIGTRVYKIVLEKICRVNGLHSKEFASSVKERIGRLSRLWALVVLRGSLSDESVLRGEILEPMLKADMRDDTERMPIYFMLEYMVASVYDDGSPPLQAIHEYAGFKERQPMRALAKILDRKSGFRPMMPLEQRLADIIEWTGLYDAHAAQVTPISVIPHTWVPVSPGRCFAGNFTVSDFKYRLKRYVTDFNQRHNKAKPGWPAYVKLLHGARSQLAIVRGETVKAWLHESHPVLIVLMASITNVEIRKQAVSSWGSDMATITRTSYHNAEGGSLVPTDAGASGSVRIVKDTEYKWILQCRGGRQLLVKDDQIQLYQFVFDVSRAAIAALKRKANRGRRKMESSSTPAMHLLTLRSCPPDDFENALKVPIGSFDFETAATSHWGDGAVKMVDVPLRLAAPTHVGFKDCGSEYWQVYDDADRSPRCPQGGESIEKAWFSELVDPGQFTDILSLLRDRAWGSKSCEEGVCEENESTREGSTSEHSSSSCTQTSSTYTDTWAEESSEHSSSARQVSSSFVDVQHRGSEDHVPEQ